MVDEKYKKNPNLAADIVSDFATTGHFQALEGERGIGTTSSLKSRPNFFDVFWCFSFYSGQSFRGLLKWSKWL